MLQYKLLAAQTSTELDFVVTKFLNDGWELYGHPNVSLYGKDSRYIQAVVRTKIDPTNIPNLIDMKETVNL